MAALLSSLSSMGGLGLGSVGFSDGHVKLNDVKVGQFKLGDTSVQNGSAGEVSLGLDGVHLNNASADKFTSSGNSASGVRAENGTFDPLSGKWGANNLSANQLSAGGHEFNSAHINSATGDLNGNLDASGVSGQTAAPSFWENPLANVGAKVYHGLGGRESAQNVSVHNGQTQIHGTGADIGGTTIPNPFEGLFS